MKKIFTSLFLIAGVCQGNAQTITWGTPVTVSSGTTSNLHPRVTLNRAGDPLVLWGKTDTKAYFSRWNGTAFTMPMTVGNTGINFFAQSWAGPDIASYGDTVYVVMKRTPETMSMNHVYMAHSYNGGMTFSDTVRVDNLDTSMSRFPLVTTNSTGNPLVGFMKFNATFADAKYVVSKSTDYGMTFSADVLASGAAGDVCDCCPASLISSGSKAILLFRNNLSNIRDIWAGVSSDGGSSFTGNMAVDNNNWMIMSCPASGPDGFVIGDTIYNTFMSTSTGTALIYLSRSSISGMTSTSTMPVTGMFTGLSSQNYPRIANAGSAATLVWKQIVSGTNMICWSFTNNIASGFSVVDTLAMGSGMMNADVAMTPGNIHIVYEDDNTGKLMYVKGTYTVPSSVSTVTAKERIEVYPNPANGNFYVNTDKIAAVEAAYLVDVSGKRMELSYSVKGNKAEFSLAGIVKGNYFFVLNEATGKTYYSKLIVE